MAKDAVQSYLDLIQTSNQDMSYYDAINALRDTEDSAVGKFTELQKEESDGISPVTVDPIEPAQPTAPMSPLAERYMQRKADALEPMRPKEQSFWSTVGNAVWSFGDEALFGIPEWVATKGFGVEFEQWEDQTGTEKALETLGRFGGFALGFPLRAGKKAVQYVGGKAINKVLKEETTDQLVKRVKAKAVKEVGELPGASKAVQQTIRDAGNSYYQINKRAQWSKSFAKNFNTKSSDTMRKIVDKRVARKEITREEGEALFEIFNKNLTKQSAHDFATLMQIKARGGKGGAILGEMINEALVWGTIDAAMEFPRSQAEGREYDWTVPIFGFAMGSALGPLGMWNLGGKNASFKSTFADGMRALFARDAYKGMDLGQLKNYAKWHGQDMAHDLAGRKLKDMPKSTITVTHNKEKYVVDFNEPSASLSIDKSTNKAMTDDVQAEILKKALDSERKKYGKELVKMAFTEEWDNLTRVFPRMIAGGVIMAAPNAAMYAMGDENVDWQTTFTHVLMGASIMRRGYGANWDINSSVMGRLRRGLDTLGIDVHSDAASLPLFSMHGNDSIDPFSTSAGLAEIKSQSEQLGVLTKNSDATEGVLPKGERSAYDEIIEGNLPLFHKLWLHLGNPGIDTYRVSLQDIPANVAKDLENRMKKGSWDELGGNTMDLPQDFDMVFKTAINDGIDHMGAVLDNALRGILTDRGLNYDVDSGYNMGALWENVYIGDALKAEAEKGLDGKLEFLFRDDPEGDWVNDIDLRVEIAVAEINKVNKLIAINNATGRADYNTNSVTKNRELGGVAHDEGNIDVAADKFRHIYATIKAAEEQLSLDMNGRVKVDLANPHQDLVGLISLNAAKKGADNTELAFNTDEITHQGLRRALLDMGILVRDEGGDIALPNRIGDLEEAIINAPDGDSAAKMEAIKMVRGAYSVLGALGQYKGTDQALGKIDYHKIMSGAKGSLYYELNQRKITPQFFSNFAVELSSNIIAKRIENTGLTTQDISFLNSGMIEEGIKNLIRYNASGDGRLGGFEVTKLVTTSNIPEDIAIVERYNRKMSKISRNSKVADGGRLVKIIGEKPITDPNQLIKINEIMISEGQFFDQYDQPAIFLKQFFDTIEGFEPLKYAAKEFISLNPSNPNRLIAMLNSTGIIKIDPSMGTPAYSVDKKAWGEKLTDKAKDKLIKFMKGYGTSIDVVEANMADYAAKYHSQSENMFASSIGEKNLSQAEYFQKYFGGSAADVSDQNLIIAEALSNPDGNQDAVINIIRQISHIDKDQVVFDVDAKLPNISNEQYNRLAMDTIGLIHSRLNSDKMNRIDFSGGDFNHSTQTVQKNIITDYLNQDIAGEGIDSFFIDPTIRYRDEEGLHVVDVTTVTNQDLLKDPGGKKAKGWGHLVKSLLGVDDITTVDRKDQNLVVTRSSRDEAGNKRGIETIVIGEKIPMLGIFRKDFIKIETEFINKMKEFDRGGKYENLLTGDGKLKLKGMLDSFDIDVTTGQSVNTSWNDMHSEAIRSLLYLKMLGHKEFASVFSTGRDTKGNTLDKIAKRFGLAFTPSAKRMDKELYTMTSKALLEGQYRDKGNEGTIENRKAVNHYIKRNAYGVAIYDDDPTGNKSVSIKEKFENLMTKLYGDSSAKPTWDDAQAGRDDVSGFDSIAFIGTRKARALSAATGMKADGIHSIFKPIISSNDPDAMLYGKTVFIYDPYMAKNVIDKNDRLDVLLMGTGAKLGGGEQIDMPVQDLTGQSPLVDNKQNYLNNFITDYPLESLGIVQAPKVEAAAKFGQQLTAFMNDIEWKPIYEAYYQNNIEQANAMMDQYLDNPVMLRQFMLDANGLSDDYIINEMAESGGAGAQLASFGTFLNSSNFANPIAFGKNMVMNVFKRKMLDKILNPSAVVRSGGEDIQYGGKSVLIQSMDPRYRALKGTIIEGEGEDAKVIQYGETVLSHSTGEIPLREILDTKGSQKHKFSLRFIKRTKGRDADEVLTKDDILILLAGDPKVKNDKGWGQSPDSRMYKRIENILTGKDNDIETLGQFQELVVSQLPDIQLAIATTRYPRTRTNDLTFLGVKGFLDEEYGNSMIINDHDVLTVFEGDYDVDKADFFFQGTDAFWGHVEKAKQKWVWGANPDSQAPISSNIMLGAANAADAVTNNEAWRNHVGRSSAFSSAIGKVQKLSRKLGHLSAAVKEVEGGIIAEYTDPQSGQLRRVVMNHDNSIEGHRRAFETQAMIDAKANTTLFGKLDTWELEYLFPTFSRSVSPDDSSILETQKAAIASGKIPEKRIRLFEELKYDERAKEWVSTQNDLSIYAKEGILNLLDHHGKLLSLGTEIYDNGTPRSPKYKDMIDISKNYFNHASDINKSLFRRTKWRKRNNQETIVATDELFDKQKGSYIDYSKGKDKDGNWKKGHYTYMGQKARFYNESLINYYKKIGEGEAGSPLERGLNSIEAKDEYRQDNRILLEGDQFLAMEKAFYNFLDGEGTQELLMKNIAGIMKDTKKAIKAIKYLKSQFYKVKTEKQRDGLNRAIKEHEAILSKIQGKEGLEDYLSSGQIKDLPEALHLKSIESDQEMMEGTAQMYTLSPVTSMFTGSSKEFKADLSDMRTLDAKFWSDQLDNLKSTLKFKDTTLLTEEDAAKFVDRPNPDTIEKIMMEKLEQMVEKHGIMFLWQYAKPKEGTGVAVFNNKPIPYAANSSKSRFRRMMQFLGKKASEGDPYYRRVLSIVAKRHGMYVNLFSKHTNLIPDGDWLMNEQIRMPKFGATVLTQLDNYSSIGFSRNRNDMNPYAGGLHYDHTVSLFKEFYRMAGREDEFDNFIGDLSKLHEMSMGFDMIDPATYLLQMEKMQTDMYDFVRNQFVVKDGEGDVKTPNHNLKDNELYLLMGGDDHQGQGVTLNPFNSLNRYFKAQKQMLAGQATEMASKPYDNKVEEYLYGGCGGRAQ